MRQDTTLSTRLYNELVEGEGNEGGSSTGGNGGNSGGNSGGNGSGNGGETPGGGSSTGSDTLAAPTISGNTPFAETTQVTLSGPEDARIYYTTDGNTPTAESTLYSEPFTLSDTTIVKAIAIKDEEISSVSSKTFTKGTAGGDDTE